MVGQHTCAVFGQLVEHERIVLDFGKLGRVVALADAVADDVIVRQLLTVDVVDKLDDDVRHLPRVGCDVDVSRRHLLLKATLAVALDGLDVVIILHCDLLDVVHAAE